VFTPATKEEKGKHDENISFERMAGIVGARRPGRSATSPSLFTTRPPPTLFERGSTSPTRSSSSDGRRNLILIDEALTPDSSRFWPAEDYRPGGPQKSFDKQFVRDYLLTLPWNKTAPGPRLPADVVEKTALKYREALTILTGKDIE
jgi:phosphoribosylaminoimidazole-succinocarboxamide synthase